MKKLNIILLAMAMAFTAGAQDLVSKKGEPILPEAGDYALGFNAVPFLRYAGNMLNQNGNAAPRPAYINGFANTIVGKQFIDSKTAYRAMVRLNFQSGSVTSLVASDDPNAAAGTMVEDKLKRNTTNITLGLGKEFRRGNTRIQGYYGAMVLLNFGSVSNTIEYGNAMDANNTAPTSTTAFDITGNNNHTVASVGSRSTGTTSGATFGLMARGFAGVEIFVFPKLSLGMEYGWGLGFGKSGGGSATTQAWDGSAAAETTTDVGARSAFQFDVDNGLGAINLLFHF